MNNLERQQDILLGRVATLEAENAHLRARRDELLAACEVALSELRDLWPDHPSRVKIETAITAAKENKWAKE